MRAFISLLLVAVAIAAPILKVAEPIPGKYIVKLKNGVDVKSITSTVSISGGRIGRVFNILNGFSAELSANVLDLVSKLSGVEYIEEDGVVRTSAVGSWGLDRIDQRNLPLDDSYTPSSNGSGTKVYVIDTGVNDQHLDFGGRAYQIISFVDGEYNSDCHGHGTHCSGTVGSNTFGVAKLVNIVGVKVLGCLGSGPTSDVITGVEWVQADVAYHNIPAVASMSVGSGASVAFDTAVENLVASGVPTAVAAGNNGLDACAYSPGRSPSVVTVASSDSRDIRSYFSCRGSCVDIFAPGSDIVSTWNTNNIAIYTMSGTSMACPHVAGGLALYGSKDALLSAASSGKITDVSGSPNLLLYVS